MYVKPRALVLGIFNQSFVKKRKLDNEICKISRLADVFNSNVSRTALQVKRVVNSSDCLVKRWAAESACNEYWDLKKISKRLQNVYGQISKIDNVLFSWLVADSPGECGCAACQLFKCEVLT